MIASVVFALVAAAPAIPGHTYVATCAVAPARMERFVGAASAAKGTFVAPTDLIFLYRSESQADRYALLEGPDRQPQELRDAVNGSSALGLASFNLMFTRGGVPTSVHYVFWNLGGERPLGRMTVTMLPAADAWDELPADALSFGATQDVASAARSQKVAPLTSFDAFINCDEDEAAALQAQQAYMVAAARNGSARSEDE